MALVKCPFCEKEFPETVSRCPQCGYERKNEEIKSKNINIEILDIEKADIDYSHSGIKSCRIVGLIFKGLGFFCTFLLVITIITTATFYMKYKDYLKSESIEIREGSYEYKVYKMFDEKTASIIGLAISSSLLIAFGSTLQIIAFNAKNGAIANNVRYAMLKEINTLNQKISS